MNRADPAPPVHVAQLATTQVDAAWALTRDLSWPHRREDWELMLALGAGIGAVSDGRLVGTTLWWPYGPSAATLGLVIVDAPWRGRGLGRRLMEHALTTLDGRAVTLNATAAGMPLYLSLGFAVTGEIEQYQGMLAPRASDAEAALPAGIRPATPADAPMIRALDARGFGAPRDALIDRLLAEAEFLVATRAGAIIGFACRRRFGRGALIGPAVAAHEDVAGALFAAWLARSTGFVRVDIPTGAGALAELLRGAGLAPVDTVTTMRRGAGWNAPADARVFALASQAFG